MFFRQAREQEAFRNTRRHKLVRNQEQLSRLKKTIAFFNDQRWVIAFRLDPIRLTSTPVSH